MQIQFKFLEIQEKAKLAKRVKSDAAEFDDGQEVMLLDFARDFDAHGPMNELAQTVQDMRGLSGLIERCFESQLDLNDQPSPPPQPPLDEKQDSHGAPPVRDAVERDPRTANKRSKLPSEAIEILNGWLQAHTNNPYPSNAEKLELIGRTGLKRCESDLRPRLLFDSINLHLAQVNAWFYTQRCRVRKDPALTEDEMLLNRTDEGATLVVQIGDQEDQEDDDMLLTQATDSTPSLTSQESVVSSVLSIGHRNSSLKRPSPDGEVLSLDKSPACELGEVAIHILISGYIGRGLRGLGSAQVEKPPSRLSIARIVPGTFCHRFKEVRIYFHA